MGLVSHKPRISGSCKRPGRDEDRFFPANFKRSAALMTPGIYISGLGAVRDKMLLF
jgi:hypothetical protein